MVNLQALEAAIQKIENIRDHEFTFEVDGVSVCLRPLAPDEETEISRYAQIATEGVGKDQDPDQATFADFMDRMRHASLGMSIVQIGNLDLRDVEYIPTGIQNDDGKDVLLPKWEAICGVIKTTWGRPMLAQLFAKFGEMLERMELRAQEAVSFEPVDLQEELERAERRVQELKDAKKRIKQPQGARIPPKQSQQPPPPQAEEPAPQPAQAAPQQPQQASPPEQPQGRRSAVPQTAVPADRSTRPVAPEQPQQPQQEPVMVDEQGIPEPDGGDSFFDPSDPQGAIERETRRQAMLQARKVARQRADAEQQRLREEAGFPSQAEQDQQRVDMQRETNRPSNAVDLSKEAPGGALGSVRQAANLQNSIADARGEAVHSGRPRPQPQQGDAGEPARLHGKPVYKMGKAQLLEKPQAAARQHGEAAASPVKLNPTVGGRNPNFRGPNE